MLPRADSEVTRPFYAGMHIEVADQLTVNPRRDQAAVSIRGSEQLRAVVVNDQDLVAATECNTSHLGPK